MADNVLFILVDQWPAWAFGHRGADILTPNLDRLAGQGTVFANAFTTCPLCTPARAALLTGCWPHRTGVYDNHAVGYSLQESLPLSQRTWVDAAAQAGYHVGYFGKWHLGPINPERRGAHRFDPNVEARAKPYDAVRGTHSYAGMQAAYDRQGRDLLVQGRAPFWGEIRAGKSQTPPFPVMASGMAFLEEWAAGSREKPFFLTVSSAQPHFPHYLPAEYARIAESLRDRIRLPPSLEDGFAGKPWFHAASWWPCMDTSVLGGDEWRTVIAYSHAHIMLVDEAVGGLLDTLDRLRLGDSTTVVFVADHGDMEGAHNRFDKGPYFYDEVWRVPLIVRRPEAGPAVQDAFVSLLDVGATCFRLIGAEATAERPGDGRDLLPLVGTPHRPASWPQVAYGVYDLYNGMSFAIRASRDERWKYVWNPQDVDELYDLQSDPREMANLAGCPEFAERFEICRAAILAWLGDSGDPWPERIATLPPAGTVLATGAAGP